MYFENYNMSDRLSVGIVGNGFVGNAIYQNVRDKVETKVYDVDPIYLEHLQLVH